VTSSDRVTRNPETTEAAKVVAALTEKQKEIVCNASGAGMFNSGRVAGLQIAKHIVQAVLALSPAVTAAEDETRDPDHCSLIAPHLPHSWGPVDVTNLPNWCAGRPAPVVAAVPADPNKED
jgi:hypothetical protein